MTLTLDTWLNKNSTSISAVQLVQLMWLHLYQCFQYAKKIVWIMISWLYQKPADLDLNCFQKKTILDSAGHGIWNIIATKLITGTGFNTPNQIKRFFSSFKLFCGIEWEKKVKLVKLWSQMISWSPVFCQNKCEPFMSESRGGNRGSGPPLLKNHKNIGILSNTGRDPLKITKLSNQYSMLHASEMPKNGILLRGLWWPA